MSHTSAPPKITMTSHGAKVLHCTYQVAILNYSQTWEMLLGALCHQRILHTVGWPHVLSSIWFNSVSPESSFIFRIVWFYQWGGVVFTPQCWCIRTVLCFRSFSRRQPALTDMSSLRGKKGGLKGGQAEGEWVEGKWHQTKHTCWVSFPVQSKHWASYRGVSRVLASLIAPGHFSHHCHKKYKPSTTCLSLKV